MRDPLHLGDTAYEVLGLEQNASDAEIEQAFRMAVARGDKDLNEAQRARLSLRRADDRAMLDLLYYEPDATSRLSPCPFEDPQVLQPVRRLDTARRWQSQLAKPPSNARVAHCLALLWHHWAEYEERRLEQILEALRKSNGDPQRCTTRADAIRELRSREGVKCDPTRPENCSHSECPWADDCRSPAPPLGDLWRCSLACWAMLANTPSFWEKRNGAGKQVLVDRLSGRLRDLQQKYLKLNGPGFAETWRELEAAFTGELAAGAEMRKVGVGGRGGGGPRRGGGPQQ